MNYSQYGNLPVAAIVGGVLAFLVVYVLGGAWLLNYCVKLVVGEGDTFGTAVKAQLTVAALTGLAKLAAFLSLTSPEAMLAVTALAPIVIYAWVVKYFYSLSFFDGLKVWFMTIVVTIAMLLLFFVGLVLVVMVIQAIA